jgi:hypothetical protein
LRRHSGNGNSTSGFDHSASAGQLVQSSIDTPRLNVTGAAKAEGVANAKAAIKVRRFDLDTRIGNGLSVFASNQYEQS